LPLDDLGVGATPARPALSPGHAASVDQMVLAAARLIGIPFAWPEIQDGRLVHDVFPIPGSEDTQLGSSSSTELRWHCEDAFREDRADYLLLLCVRNVERAATTVAVPDLSDFSDEMLAALYSPWFFTLPDPSWD